MKSTKDSPAEGSSEGSRSILLVVENLPVPYDRRVWQEAIALKSAGFQVSVISPATKLFPKYREVLEGIYVFRYPMLIEGRGYAGLIAEYLWSFLCIWLLTIWVAASRGFKVLMCANPPDIFFPIVWMWRLFGKKTVFDHHDLCPELFATKFHVERSVLLAFFYFVERRMLRAVHKVISTNESYRTIAMRRGGRGTADVVVVRNAPDPARFSIRIPEPALRKSARYLVAFLGEIGQQDGLDVLIRSVKTVRAAFGPGMVHFVCMGAGPHFKEIVAYARAEGVAGDITFTGRADNDLICRVLSSADIAVDPCPDSPHANVSTATKIMEYMYFSLPIVAFDLVETRRSGGTAVCYARSGDEADFARQLIDLLHDEAARRALGELARIRLNSVLSWRVSTQHLLTLMEELVGSAPARELRADQLDRTLGGPQLEQPVFDVQGKPKPSSPPAPS